MDQSRAMRTSALFDMKKFTNQRIAYWGIEMGQTHGAAPDLVPRSSTVVSRLARIRTRLNAFSPEEQGFLINWGYASCDERIRSYMDKDAKPPIKLPFPSFPLK